MPERIRFAGLLAMCLVGAMAAAPHVRAAEEPIDATRADAQFKRVLDDIGQGQVGAALEAVERLLARYPNFRLAHLVRGDLLLARARPTHYGPRQHRTRRAGGHRGAARGSPRAPARLQRSAARRGHPRADRATRPDAAIRRGGRREPISRLVVIAGEVEWLDAERWHAARQRFASRLERWQRDWESGDVDRYLSHYAREFRAGDGMDRAAWGAHKRRVNATRSWIEVTLAELSVLRSPGKRELALATFEQRYRSSGFAQRSRKRQYWIVENGRWKIAYESVALGAQLALPESFPKADGAKVPREARWRPARVRR